MTTRRWKKATTILTAGVMAGSVMALPTNVMAEEKPVTITFSFDQGTDPENCRRIQRESGQGSGRNSNSSAGCQYGT